MPQCSPVLGCLTSPSLLVNATWVMLVLQSVTCFSFHFVVCDTTWQSGDGQQSGKVCLSVSIQTDIFPRPANKYELYNLRHAQLRNVVERIFGVMKKRWDILNRAPQYTMPVQARIPVGLAAVHNFILELDDTDLEHYLEQLDADAEGPRNGAGELGDGPIPRTEYERASALREQIAADMWDSYQNFLRDHPEVLEDEFIAEEE